MKKTTRRFEHCEEAWRVLVWQINIGAITMTGKFLAGEIAYERMELNIYLPRLDNLLGALDKNPERD